MQSRLSQLKQNIRQYSANVSNAEVLQLRQIINDLGQLGGGTLEQ